jgi:hypothetical protein
MAILTEGSKYKRDFGNEVISKKRNVTQRNLIAYSGF